MERIDKILSNCGIGTRKDVKQLIKCGLVKVNGQVITKSDFKIYPDSAEITVNDKVVTYKKFIYLMLNKPSGYVSATEDNRFPTVVDLVPMEYAHFNVFPVGRLDIDTEGLLILTNDGKLAHNVTSPKKHIPKKYFVIPQNDITQDGIEAFRKGMDLGDFITMPGDLEKCDGGLIATICEGKFHQVKRMFEKINNKVEFLKRIQIGNLKLDEKLPLGEIKELTQGDIEKIWI